MKNRLYSLVAAMALLLSVSSVAVADEKLDAVEKELIKAWGKIKSMSADTKMSMSMQGMTNKGTGTMEVVQKAGKQRYRTEMKSEVTMPGQEMKVDMSQIFDGEFVYTVNDMNGQKSATKAKPGPNQMGSPIGKDMFAALKTQFELEVLADETVDGEVAYVLQGKPKQNMGGPMSIMKMYFVKKHGAMVKMRGLDASGAEVMVMDYKNIKLNKKIDDSRFVFKAPEGVQVVEIPGQ